MAKAKATQQSYQEILDRWVEAGVPGVQACIFLHEKRWCGVSGLSDIENSTPMTLDTPVREGSLTKNFTLALINALIAKGRLSPDQKVIDILGEELLRDIENANEATVFHLIEHTAGFYTSTNTTEFFVALWEPENRLRNWTPHDVLDYARGQPARGPVGGDFIYCNLCYILLGLIAEEVTNEPLNVLYKEYIFQPAGMDSTYLEGVDEIPGGIAPGYYIPGDQAPEDLLIREQYPAIRDDGLARVSSDRPTYNSWAAGAGATASTAPDFAKFINSVWNGEFDIFLDRDDDWIENATTESRTIRAGGSWGMSAHVWFGPKHGYVIVFANANRVAGMQWPSGAIAGEILQTHCPECNNE